MGLLKFKEGEIHVKYFSPKRLTLKVLISTVAVLFRESKA